MAITSTDLAKSLKAEADRLGFVSCGIARADVGAEQGQRLREWLTLGSHGDMGWMEGRAEQRAIDGVFAVAIAEKINAPIIARQPRLADAASGVCERIGPGTPRGPLYGLVDSPLHADAWPVRSK